MSRGAPIHELRTRQQLKYFIGSHQYCIVEFKDSKCESCAVCTAMQNSFFQLTLQTQFSHITFLVIDIAITPEFKYASDEKGNAMMSDDGKRIEMPIPRYEFYRGGLLVDWIDKTRPQLLDKALRRWFIERLYYQQGQNHIPQDNSMRVQDDEEREKKEEEEKQNQRVRRILQQIQDEQEDDDEEQREVRRKRRIAQLQEELKEELDKEKEAKLKEWRKKHKGN